MLLKPARVDVRQLSYDAATKHFVGEVSDTHGFGRAYDDACDEGLTLVGTTGVEVVFVVQEEHRNADGDVTHWDLQAVSPAGAHRPGQYTMTLFND